MTVPQECPAIECWQAYFGEAVPPEQREDYERHLESCPTCQERLDRTEECADALRRLVRRSGDPTTALPDPILTRFLERLHEVKGPERTPLEPADLYFLRPPDRPELLGVLGSYEVQEVIGQGGMGVVLKAFDPGLHRLVAIKVLAAAVAGSAVARRRFTREAKAAAAVCHDHIVTVHGVHTADGLPYLVMQYVAGESLQDRLDRVGPLAVEEVVRIGAQTAAGLAAAHAQGLIHRDIKPANLLLTSPMGPIGPIGPIGPMGLPGVEEDLCVKITDFGLARMIDDVALTQNGVVAGTPEYMAPEQARGETVDHRADLFSLGSVLYACCTGEPPFRGSTALAVLRQVGEHVPASIRDRNPNVPTWLEALIARLMQKDPALRFQSAAETAGLLEDGLAHLRQPAAIAAPELPPSPIGKQAMQATMSPWKRLLPAILLVGVLALLGAIGARALISWEPPPRTPGGGPAAMDSGNHAPGAPKHGLVCLLVNKNSGRCLSIGAAGKHPGSRIVQGPTPDQAGPAERWMLLAAGKAFRLRNESSRLVLEIGSANRDPGVQAIQWHDQANMKNQHWTFEPGEDGYRLRAGHSQFVLCIGKGMLDAGAPATQWMEVPDVPDQIWEIRPVGGSPGEASAMRSPQETPAPPPPLEGWAPWWAAGLAPPLFLAAWLVVRRRRPAGKPAIPVPDRQEAAVSFACSTCGKNLKARANLAGKKVKCLQCGETVLVPAGAERAQPLRGGKTP